MVHSTVHPPTSLRLAALATISLVTPAFAVLNIDYVTVGNAGNAADTATGSLYGAVAYAYQIAKNETTISQYAEFLNAVAKTDTYGLYSGSMTTSHINGISQGGASGSFTYSVASGSGNKPVTFVSWFDAARFTNWMHNGQPVGLQTVDTTEGGAYALNGATSGVSISRNVGATVWIPSENEWYKAAYYDPGKGGVGVGGYWAQPTQSDSLPTSNTIGDPGAANFFHNLSGFVGYPGAALTDGGAYGANSASHYGTNDQAGNVWEWNEAVISSSRGVRGGAWNADVTNPSSSVRPYLGTPMTEDQNVGFRVASVIPEPTSFGLTLLTSGMLLLRRKRG